MTTKLDRVPPLLRAFAVLEQVASGKQPLTLQEATAAAGLPKPTVHRLLAMLEHAGLVAREPDGKRVAPGPRLARLALDVLTNDAVRAPRRAILARLVDTVGETCNLTMLDGEQVLYLDRVESAWPLRVTLQPGSRVPLHCTASGKLLLALLPPARRARLLARLPLPAHTPNTITSRSALEQELRQIRRERVALDREEYLAGLVCVAVPVATSTRRVVASVAVHAPVMRMPLERALAHAPALASAADALGETFG
jgi:IclR family transcriptional regulator, acetate operon repressor